MRNNFRLGYGMLKPPKVKVIDPVLLGIQRELALLVEAAMVKKKLGHAAFAKQMGTSRAGLHRLLDPKNDGVPLDLLQKAAKAVGKRIQIELV